ncbi:hypothetical protein B9Z55_024660 [Caenorhabditis nigoni]|uniref:Uncharacterized protein n=2 Tax=Caenorhabditis nigoni TaxID=1611254 RepID=A0A2G5SV59_9PELO|nr:hypothetical protein B9Z55_024660 [Caenorhabditis nigoni]
MKQEMQLLFKSTFKSTDHEKKNRTTRYVDKKSTLSMSWFHSKMDDWVDDVTHNMGIGIKNAISWKAYNVSIIAQTLGREEAGPNENATETVVPSGTAEKYHNATDPSFLYIVQLELKSSRVEEPYGEIEKRLDKLVEMAFALAAYKHRKQTPPAEITTSNSGYKTKIIRKRTSGDLTYIHFVTYAANEPILGEIVADDMTLLTKSQMSATLRYPLSKIISDRDIENQSTTKLWFLIGILGTGIILIVIGWLCLFFFFNVCGFVYGSKAAAYMARDDEGKKPNVIKFPSPTVSNVKLAAEKPVHTLPFDGSNTALTLEKPVLNSKLYQNVLEDHKINSGQEEPRKKKKK